MPRDLPAPGPGFSGPALASLALHAVVFCAIAGLFGWFGGGGTAKRALVIGVGEPQLRAPAHQPEAEAVIISCGPDEVEPLVSRVAEEFPLALYEAFVLPDALPGWLQTPPHVERQKSEVHESAPAGVTVLPPPLLVPAGISAATCPAPAYPRLARRRGEEGTVWLHLRVSAEGLPEEVLLEISSGHALLDEAALTAARAWQLIPALRDGVPVEGVLRVPVTFRLEAAR